MSLLKKKLLSSKLFGIVPLEYSRDIKKSRCQKLSRTRGFTLVELLVVISIIAFLSSIVLASLNTARDKAKAKVFIQELNQFTNALELYRSDYGNYPPLDLSVDNIYRLTLNSDGTVSTSSIPVGFNLGSLLLPYLKKLPTPTKEGIILRYKSNGNLSLVSGRVRCMGDTNIPAYIIYTLSYMPGLDNWVKGGEAYTSTGWSPFGGYPYCFSLK
jgi:prepilin-type N-terminal cleavage/methylation domain-containing protein